MKKMLLRKSFIILSAICFSLLFGSCGGNEHEPKEEKPDSFAIETTVIDGYAFAEEGEQTVYTFSRGGEYALKGTLKGRLEFSEAVSEEVVLRLDGITVTSDQTALAIASTARFSIVAAEGSVNTIKNTNISFDGELYAAINSSAFLAFSGDGKLTVYGNQSDAILAKGFSVEGNINLNVCGYRNGIDGRGGNSSITGGTSVVTGCDGAAVLVDALRMTNGALNIESCGGAVYCTRLINIARGKVTVNGCGNSFYGASNINVEEGTTTVDGIPFIRFA